MTLRRAPHGGRARRRRARRDRSSATASRASSARRSSATRTTGCTRSPASSSRTTSTTSSTSSPSSWRQTSTDEAFWPTPWPDRLLVSGVDRLEERFGDVRDQMLDELRVFLPERRGHRVRDVQLARQARQPTSPACTARRAPLHVDHALRSVTLEVASSLPSAFGRLVPAFDQGATVLERGREERRQFARNEFHFFSGMTKPLHALLREHPRATRPLPIAYRDILRVAG